jgi:pimeloyl-ACP methyl ester carboxylesterase
VPSFDGRGFPIYYEVHGQDQPALPLVLSMGMGGSYVGWLPLQVPEFSRARPTVVYDHRGVGKSADPEEDFTTADLAEDLRGLLDHLRIQQAHVLGGFLGGLVAQELAIAHPERVRSLILLGSYARASGRLRMLLEIWQGMVEQNIPLELQIRNRLTWTLHDLAFEQEDLIEALQRFYLREGRPLSDKNFVRQARAALEHDTLARLDRIEAPTLVVSGEQDMLTPPHLQRELASHIHKSRLVLVRGAGHLVAAEHAARFNRLVSRFVDEYDFAEDRKDW